MTKHPYLPNLNCSWASWIDFEGLNKADRDTIKRVGFDKWLDQVTGAGKERVMPVEKKAVEAAEVKGQKTLGIKFLEIARANDNIVTYDQAKELCPDYPGDPVAWARSMGAQVKTQRKERTYRVEKYV